MSFWESSVFWGIAGIIGGFIVAAFFFYVGKAKKSLVYQISTSALITDEINSTPGLKISVGNEPAINVSSTTITFINGGNQTINSSDFATLSPLQIITSEHFFNAENIDVSYIKTRNKALNPRIRVVEKNKIIVEFEYLKPKQEFEITVLHDGELSVSGDLKTGILQSYNSALKTSGYKHISKVLVPVLITIITGILTVTLSSVMEMYRDSTSSVDSIRDQVYDLQNRITEMRLTISELEADNQLLRDRISLLMPISGTIPDPQ